MKTRTTEKLAKRIRQEAGVPRCPAITNPTPTPEAAQPAAGLVVRHDDDLINEFRTIVENHQGCNSPAETFICDLVRFHSARALTPDCVRRYLEEFESDFNAFVADAQRFNKQYPELVNPQESDGSTAD
ncbi:MAG TPA: hypothetical protein VM120_03990 [Bryobacteraceae bacterium]|nr:hypothetical protein [Bryobacteraceae bacterium]